MKIFIICYGSQKQYRILEIFISLSAANKALRDYKIDKLQPENYFILEFIAHQY